jgi:ankyrin repeat protein
MPVGTLRSNHNSGILQAYSERLMENPKITVDEIRSLDRLTAIVRAGADINDPCTEHFSPLGLAASYALLPQCKLLIDAGADVNFCSNAGASPLSQLLSNRAQDRTPTEKDRIVTVARLLLSSGASPEGNLITGKERPGWHLPIFQAVQFGHLDVIPILAEYGANLDAHFQNQGSPATPLSTAMQLKNVDTTLSLLRNGARALETGSSDTNLLQRAAMHRLTPVIECLIDELGIDPTDFLNSTSRNPVFPSPAIRELMRATWESAQAEKTECAILDIAAFDQHPARAARERSAKADLAI